MTRVFPILASIVYLGLIFLPSGCPAQSLNLDSVYNSMICLDADLDVMDDKVAVDAQAFHHFWSAVERARVVVVGELDHRDGSTLALKSELFAEFAGRYDSIIYLVEYGVGTMQEIHQRVSEGQDSVYFHYGYLKGRYSGASSRAFNIIANRLQTVYDDTSIDLLVGGVDVFESTGYLDLYLNRIIPDNIILIDKRERHYNKEAIIKSITDRWRYKPFNSDKEARAYYQKIDPAKNRKLIRLLLSQLTLNETDVNILRSLSYHDEVRKMWYTYPKLKGKYVMPEVLKLRDSIMAVNVLNYVEQYPNHKIMISVSNFHAARSMSRVYEKRGGGIRTMCSYLDEALGKDIATFAVVRYTGAAGKWRYQTPGKYEEVCRKKSSSIEAVLAKRCKSVGYLPLDSYLIDRRFRMHATFESSPRHIWATVYDGIFFIHTMQTDVAVSPPRHRMGVSFPN